MNRAQLSAALKVGHVYIHRVSGASLTVLQGKRGAVHRLALGRSSALRVGHRAGAANAAPKAGAQLQAPHVANYGCGVKGLLRRQRRTNIKIEDWNLLFANQKDRE